MILVGRFARVELRSKWGGDAAVKLRLLGCGYLPLFGAGPEIHRFLNHAAAAGVRLRRVRWQKDGCSAAADAAWTAVGWKKIAADGGWVITVTARRGPGRRAETLLQTRPGLAAGHDFVFVLLKFLGGFVWCVDFGAMDADLQPTMRPAACRLRLSMREPA